MDRGAWGATVHRVAQSRTQLKQLSTHTHMVALFLVFLKKSPHCSPQWLYQFTFPLTVQEGSLFSTSSEPMAPHSSTLAWKISWTEEPGRLSLWGRWESDTTERLHFHFSLSCIGEGNGSPLQCSCLENPRDGGAWWAAVYGVTQSQTRLKRLSSSSSSNGDADIENRLVGTVWEGEGGTN